MRPEQRRRADRIGIVLSAVVVGVIALIAAFAGDTERIGAYWAHADFDSAGNAQVTEVIDYDFGSNRKHGLLRQIPDVAPSAPFTVESPSAPDQFQLLPWWQGTEVRVGDPFSTISNRHRYELTYPHTGLVIGDRVGWNAIGDGWSVPISEIEIHVSADRELLNPTCDTGRVGDAGGCTVSIAEPGHLVVVHDKVSPGEFLTVYATLGGPAPPTAVTAPRGTAPDPGSGWKTPALLAGLAALLGATLLSPFIRRAGREWMWAGGAADAAFGPTDDAGIPRRRVDHDELREMATIEFEAPRDMSAAFGGVVHLERVHEDHMIAWLLEAAVREEITFDPQEAHPKIERGTAAPNPTVAKVLDKMFGGSSTVNLEEYNPIFVDGWQELNSQLDSWRESSGLWDAAGRRSRHRAIGLGILAFVIGVALTTAGAAMANRNGSGWYAVVAVGGGIAGLGIAAMLRSWELRVRTAQGSGAWIQIESFRRFLHDSEAQHVERAAEMGLLRQYTAWAVALGEVDRWENAVRDAASQPGSPIQSYQHTNFVMAAPMIARAVSTASTAPSSSGSGGGGGAGGGGGGGGGGSW